MKEKIAIEVCAGSLHSIRAAEAGGASRIELCAALGVGGLTPTQGLIIAALELANIPVFPIIRPREGDFVYSAEEVEVMVSDIRMAVDLGVNGVVIGALTPDGELDEEACKKMLEAAKGLPVTLHRAIDRSSDMLRATSKAIDLGFSRILTSGGAPTALQGVEMIRKMVQLAEERLTIMPGAGVNAGNISEIIRQTGSREIHGSFSHTYLPAYACMGGQKGVTMGANDDASGARNETDPNSVRRAVEALEGL